MPIESYSQAIEFWHSRVNYEHRGMPADLRELKLDRMRDLLRHLGHPERGLRIVHIAGSKGKGSVAAFVASILQEAGHKTGLFTSPHLMRVEERVQLNGVPIAPEELISLMRRIEQVAPAVEREHASGLTFFEVVTALGFLFFARQQVDVAVIEVGLGGRFDSTNVCSPSVCVITSISFDHTQQLGNTLSAIAREKAGIIKPGIPVVSGVTDAEPAQVIRETARERSAPLTVLGEDFWFTYSAGQVTAGRFIPPLVSVRTRRKTYPRMELSLMGEHQAANAAVAVAAIEQVQAQGLAVPDRAVQEGLRKARWPGRIQLLGTRPFRVVDSAHNVASCEALVRTLLESFPKVRRKVLVFGVSRDKDLPGILKVLVPHFQTAIFTRYRSSQRGAEPEELSRLWSECGGQHGQVVSVPQDAWQQACQLAGEADLVCATGSVFLAGELLAVVENRSGDAAAWLRPS